MRISTPYQALGAAVGIAIMASCSGGSGLAPSITSSQSGTKFMVGHVACPATGTIVYLSDAAHNVINIYAGKLAGQSPCGQITFGLNGLQGLFVDPATH